MAAKRIGDGAVIAAGLGRTCNGGVTYKDQRWTDGELDVLLDCAFKWMKPGAKKVLWYGEYNSSLLKEDKYEYAFCDAKACSWLIDSLEAKGYVVDDSVDGTFTPITSSLLDPYDILVLAAIQLGPCGGNPDLLPDNVVAIITDFVKVKGRGLFIMDCGDYDGYNYHLVNNKILEALGFGVFFQNDCLADPETDPSALKYVTADVNATTDIGADYQAATGKTTIKLYKVPSLSVPEPGAIVEIAPNYQASTPGSTLVFSVSVTNPDEDEDSYVLTVRDNAGWGLTLKDERLLSVPGPGKSKKTTLTVTIPGGAAIGAEDNIIVTAASVVKPNVSGSCGCIVRATMQIAPPIDDAQVVEGSPSTSYGGRTFMYVGSSTTGVYLDERAFLKFDLTRIPSTIPPNNWVAADLHARLYVYCFTTSGALGKNVQVRGVDNDNWSEMKITWNDQPAYGGVLDTRAVTEVGWYSWDVTSHVQSQFRDDKVASFCLRADTEDRAYPDNFSYGFNSKEYADIRFWPYLELVSPYKVDVSIKPWIQDNSPGGTLTYTVIVTNKGSENDSYSLSAEDTRGWGPTIAQNRFADVQPEESRTTTLTVIVPSDASICTKDTITVTATGTGVSDSASCVAHAFEGVELSPTDDAYVSEYYPNSNYGGENTIYLQSSASNNERIFLKFDLSAIPAGSRIIDAEVWLRCRKAELEDVDAQCRKVTDDDWSENLITWGTRPTYLDVLDTVTLKYSPPSEDMWHLWNVTSFVQSEYAGDKIASFCIRAGVEDVGGRYTFDSKEWPLENERPRIKIAYTVENVTENRPGVQVSTSSSSQSGLPGATLTYTVTVTNTGTNTDTFDLTVSDVGGWGPTISPTSLTVSGGESGTAALSIKVPDNAAEGDSTTITVTATGTGCENSATCTAAAEAKASPGISPLVYVGAVIVIVVIIAAVLIIKPF